MTVKQLFEVYKTQLAGKKLVLCNQQVGDGFMINSSADFETMLQYYGDIDLYITTQNIGEDMNYYEFFIFDKSPVEMVAVIRHPTLSNAYFREIPDRIIDIHSIEMNLYRMMSVDYGQMMKEIIIELPSKISPTVWQLLRKRFVGAFPKDIPQNTGDVDWSYSIVFTNTDRFNTNEQLGFRAYPVGEIYPRVYKFPTMRAVSNKFWKELKAIKR